MSAETPTPDKLTAASVFERLLTYADKPWKAVVILVLVIICGAGWLVWTERARLADALLHSAGERAVIDEAAFVAAAAGLLRDTRADLVLLVELQLSDNLMVDRVGIDPDGNRWVPLTGPQQALSPASAMPLLVRFLANEVVCIDSSVGINEDARALAARGYVRYCLVAVPPILGVSVGGLVAAWKQPPLPASELRAGLVLKAAAMKFATW